MNIKSSMRSINNYLPFSINNDFNKKIINSPIYLKLAGALSAMLILYIIYYIYTTYTKNKVKEGYKANNEKIQKSSDQADGTTGNSSNKEAEIMFFSAKWCVYCKKAMPEWEQIKTEYSGKVINGYNLVFTEIDCTTESPEVEKMMNKFKVEGFPTIKLLKNNQVIDYDAKVTSENLAKFINTAI